MRNVILIIAGCIFLSACTVQHQKASSVGLVPLDNYFVKNSVVLSDDYTYKVMTSQQEFDATVGMAATMNNTIRKPDFSGQTVVAVIGKPSTQQQEIKLEGANLTGKELNVYYKVVKGGSQSHTSTSLGVATVPKASSVKEANFYQDSVLVKTIPVNIY